MTRPRFSIVIPTRNRADLLPGALRSAMAQTYPDLEIVVSDNASTDDTAAVIERCRDEGGGEGGDRGRADRVRAVRTPRALPMHESWAFAVGQARGTYIGVLCDDDALCPRALERADLALRWSGAEVAAWRTAALRLADWPDAAERGRLMFGPPFGDRVFAIDGPRLLDLAYDLRIMLSDAVPKLLNGVVARATLARARAAGVTPCGPSCPDFGAMVTMATFARGLVVLDAPLMVVGSTPRSVGASSLRYGAAARVFADELFERCPGLVRPPVLGPIATWIGQTLMQCARDMPALHGRRVNTVHMYGLAARELADAGRAGFDIGGSAAALEAALAGPLAAQAAAIRAFAEQGPVIESEGFLARRADAPSVLGVGAVVPPRLPRVEAGAPIEQVAVGIERMLRDRAVRLDDVWAAIAAGAGSRDVVLYGAGANGRALARLCPPSLADRLHVTDDRPVDGDPGGPVLVPAALDPRRHLVVVTPDAAAPIVTRLSSRGFIPGRDVRALRSEAPATQPAREESLSRAP